jgi:hypothetical protein
MGDVMRSISKTILLATLAATLAGCGSIRDSYQLLSFQPDPRSGVGNQVFEVFLLAGAGREPAVARTRFQSVKPGLTAVSPAVGRELRACEVAGQRRVARQSGKQRFAVTTVVPAIISYAASAAFDAIKQSIATKAEKIAKASQKSGSVRLVHSRGTGVSWQHVNCVVITRIDRDTKAPGLIAVLQKRNHGNASVLVPRVYWLGNSIAWTAKATANQAATAQVDIGLALHAVTNDRKTGLTVIRKEMASGCDRPDGAPELCANATPLIPLPPASASAVMVSVNIQETGSSANTKQIAEATNKVLDDIAKPVLDEFVKQLTSMIQS